MIKWKLGPALAFLLLAYAVSFATDFDFSTIEKSVTAHTLKNGLTVLVMERTDAPVVSFVTWVNAGSADDPKGYTGLAHMFEHMAFKGTPTIGTKNYGQEVKAIALEDTLFMQLRAERNKGRFADTSKVAQLQKQYEDAREDSYKLVEPNQYGNIIEREGGVGLNAGTSYDWTVYTYSLPSNKMELWMAMESERFLNPVLREMYKERDVIAEERRMRTESSPGGRLREEFLSMAFKAHPYGIPTVGHMSDINYYSRKEAKSFFDKYYVPSNMVVAIVGDVKAPEVIAMAEKYWSRISYKPKPERIATVEPPQLGERRTTLEDPAQPLIYIGFRIPEMNDPDRPAIDAYLEYLASGRTSVLYKSMVKEKKIAIQVGSFSGYPGEKYPNLATFVAVPSAGHTASECEEIIEATIDQTQKDLIPAAELDKIKARAKAQFVGQLENNSGLAFQLAAYQTYWGDWQQMFRELGRIKAVTPEDIQRVAQKYFTHNGRTVAMMNTIKS